MTMRGLRLTVFYDKDNYMKNDVKNRFVLEGLFEHPHIVAGYDILDATIKRRKHRHCSTAADIHLGDTIFKQKGNGPEVLLRWDSYVPSAVLWTPMEGQEAE